MMALSLIIISCLVLGAPSLVFTAFRQAQLPRWWRGWLCSLGAVMGAAVIRVFVR